MFDSCWQNSDFFFPSRLSHWLNNIISHWKSSFNLVINQTFSSLHAIFKKISAIQNYRIAKALMSYTLFVLKIWSFENSIAQKVSRISGSHLKRKIIVLCPFNIQGWFFCSWTGKRSAYANEAKYLPAATTEEYIITWIRLALALKTCKLNIVIIFSFKTTHSFF